MANDFSFRELFGRMLRAEGQSRAARTVELFGWLILIEAPIILLAPHFSAAVLHMPPLTEQGANFFRLVAVLIGGLGMLYVASGRLNAEGFVFASLLDRPLVPFVMAALWHFDIVPGPLALAFSIQDFGSFLWTLITLRSESRSVGAHN